MQDPSARTRQFLSYTDCDFESETTYAPDRSAIETLRLNKLPGELRNRIYRFVLVLSDDIRLELDTPRDFRTSAVRYGANLALPLLATCKQIRAEALPIFFAENRFEFGAYMFLPRDEESAVRQAWDSRFHIAGWLFMIGVSAQHIKCPIINLGRWYLPDVGHDQPTEFLLEVMKKFKAICKITRCVVSWKLQVVWTSPMDHDSLTMTFSDAASARSAFEEAFYDEKELVSSLVAECKESWDRTLRKIPL